MQRVLVETTAKKAHAALLAALDRLLADYPPKEQIRLSLEVIDSRNESERGSVHQDQLRQLLFDTRIYLNARTQKELAAKMGISGSHLSGMFSGKLPLTDAIAKRIGKNPDLSRELKKRYSSLVVRPTYRRVSAFPFSSHT